MMNSTRTLHAFEPDLVPAEALASALGCPCHLITHHAFPDGESLVRIVPSGPGAILYRRLDQPNGKLVELLLAADALAVANPRPALAVPYLPYMRQDAAFHPGEAVSQRVIGRLLGQAFSTIATIEPHLHRVDRLDTILPGATALALSAAPALAELVGTAVARPLLVGPDGESARLVGALAERTACDWFTLEKRRLGDRSVSQELPPHASIAGRHVLLVDDICSTGVTLAEAARLIASAGAASIEALVVHANFDRTAAALMRDADIARVRSTDTLAHPSNAVSVTSLLAGALQRTFP